MHNRSMIWIAAILITVISVVYQKRTGPTYPKKGRIIIDGSAISFTLPRSELSGKEAEIRLMIKNKKIKGRIRYKRFRSNDEWEEVAMKREGDILKASLPTQPAAGKIIYYVILEENDSIVSLTGSGGVVLRYKGDVPTYLLIPHIILMFMAMLLSNRAGIEAAVDGRRTHVYMIMTIWLLFIGGFIIGPLIQRYAFGSYWTGIPFGKDLTDNKTLIAMLGWLAAWFKNRRSVGSRGWIIGAACLMFIVYLIPHSLMGSELDYTQP